MRQLYFFKILWGQSLGFDDKGHRQFGIGQAKGPKTRDPTRACNLGQFSVDGRIDELFGNISFAIGQGDLSQSIALNVCCTHTHLTQNIRPNVRQHFPQGQIRFFRIQRNFHHA